MILVLCRSEIFFETLASMSADENFRRFTGTDLSSFSAELAKIRPELVIYETSYFVDPAPFRLASPATRFVVAADPGDELRTEEALRHGAVAALHKPLVAGETLAVLALAR